MDKRKESKNNTKKDGEFNKKNITHNPQSESARATFGAPEEKHLD